jgi:hypothetical protein
MQSLSFKLLSKRFDYYIQNDIHDYQKAIFLIGISLYNAYN